MPPALRLAAPLLLVILSTNAYGQDSDLYKVKDSATPCLKIRPQPTTDSNPTDCLAPGTQVTVLESIPYWRKVRPQNASEGWASKRYLEPVTAPSPASPPSTLPQDAWLEVHFVDVGQGDGIWIHTYDDGIAENGIFEGRNIVID